MVFPLLAALAGAGGSIASALIGADAMSENNETNWIIQLYNLAERRRERREALEEARRIEGKQDLGATNAQGDRTYFKEGVGWVTELGDQSQDLLDYFYNSVLPEQKGQFARNATASRETNDIANELLNAFRRVRPDGSEMETKNLLYSQAVQGQSEANRETTENAMRQALRMGRNDIGDILGDIGSAARVGRGNARTDAYLKAKDYTASKMANKRGELANLYSMFAQRAGVPLQSPVDPFVGQGQANDLMKFFAGQGQQGNAMGLQALLNTTRGTLQPREPDLGWANAAGAIGTGLSGAFERMGGYFDKKKMNDMLLQYLSGGGQIDMGGGGIFGNILDRFNKVNTSF